MAIDNNGKTLRTARMGQPAVLTYLRENAVGAGVVPKGPAMHLRVGIDTFTIEGGEALWMKKDSTTEFFLTLEDANVQLSIVYMGSDVYRITRKAIGSTRHSLGRRVAPPQSVTSNISRRR